MKIAFITLSTIPSTTANSIYSMKMCEALKKRGIDVYLVVPKTKSALIVRNIYNFYGISKKFPIIKAKYIEPWSDIYGWGYSTFYRALELKPDLIYTLYVKTAMFAALFGIPFVYEIHMDLSEPIDNYAFRIVNNSKNLIKIVSITHSSKNYLIKKFNIKQGLIEVLPDAVDLDKFPKAKYFEREGKKKLRIGYVGHLYKGRGIDTVLEIAKFFSKFKFEIVGGDKEDIMYWKTIVERKKIKNVFLKGFIAPCKIPFYLSYMDILLMPYQKKVCVAGNVGDTSKWMSPMKMFDYMASGKPIIASNLPILREVLRNRENCILVPCNNIIKWKEEIEFLLNNPDFAIKIGMTARKEVEKKYTWDLRAKKIVEFIHKKHCTYNYSIRQNLFY
jgi:glycosyltransferase involved in cell wall biosynthesis